jgi:hypothetical protein
MAVNMEDAHNQTGANAKKAFMVQPVAEVKKVLKQHWREYGQRHAFCFLYMW